MDVQRPSISRETRALFMVVLVSITALWALARLRFPERAMSPNPVQPVLAQLGPASPLETFATAVRDLEPQVLPSLVLLERLEALPSVEQAETASIGLRLPNGQLAAFSFSRTGQSISRTVARDEATGLSIVETLTADRAVTTVRPWAPERPSSRFLLAAEASRTQMFLRPVFIGSFTPTAWPTWDSAVWALPAGVDVQAGTFLFTTEARLAGAAVPGAGGMILVPGDVLMSASLRLLERPPEPGGYLGLDVQPLSAAVGEALGAKGGLAVIGVDPDGPAASRLRTTDVLEEANGVRLESEALWRAVVSRVPANGAVSLKVRRESDRLDVSVTAVERAPRPAPSQGLTLRARRGAGSEIVRVTRGSPADRAGLRPGDLITFIGDRPTPSPEAVDRVFAGTDRGRFVALVVRRHESNTIVAVEKSW